MSLLLLPVIEYVKIFCICSGYKYESYAMTINLSMIVSIYLYNLSSECIFIRFFNAVNLFLSDIRKIVMTTCDL